MTREKIRNDILATVTGQAGGATVSSTELDAMEPPVVQRDQFMGELAWDLGCLVYAVVDGGYFFTPDTADADTFARFQKVHEEWRKTEQILRVLRAQHNALDSLLARVIVLDRTFFPSKSGHIWDAVVAGNELIKELEAK